MEDRFVATVAADTGSVPVSVDASGSPSYIITEDVAWDRIPMNEGILEAAASASALVFGSLAQRSQGNQDSLARLREAHNGLILFDINLRAPFDDLSLVEHLGQGVDVLKLNNEELERWVGDHLENGARRLSDRLGCERVLVTAGAKGAGLLDGAGWHWVDTPSVTVADTVGAGDSFAAAFLDGLLAGKDGPECLRRASSLAAWVASSQGATPDYTTCLEWVRA
jgi:fructokinase